MNTPEDQPHPDEALARARAAREQMAAALDEGQEPGVDEPVGWQRVWKRPRKPEAGSRKSKAAKKVGLRKQRKRLQEAAKRRLAARNSHRSRVRQRRIGIAAARRDVRALSRMRHSGAWL
ncbi:MULTISPECIES: hypothetical protein [Streptomyces]|uniref:hypothetical protein n=1 Tax=Streptomyces TaxID=1883 RepID=UPI0016762B3F|nr:MULTISPECIES: hypothetical protein [Streptomyces]MBK3521162.1 hypothetical protein [Streptomyces sp. MBT70]GGR59428.1 hypothetical protein GCM10010236_10090 [Streptomyces eurythermus]